MRRLFPLYLLFLLLSASVADGQQPIKLPKSIHVSLDKTYPGWRFSEVTHEVDKFFRERFPSDRPNLISGDFDGDGHEDYAMLIEHTNFNEPGKSFTHILERLAFLKRGKGYKRFDLEEYGPADPDVYMNLAKKGATSHEFPTNKEFKYPTDSISISYFEKAGGTYIYKKGKFRYVSEGD